MTPDQQLAWDSPVCCAVLGKGDTCCLVPLGDSQDHSATKWAARERGFYYVGTIGLLDGQVKVAFGPELNTDAVTIMFDAARSFGKRLDANEITKADWLERLHALPDTRPEDFN